jgi:hypothetical protein
MGQGEFIAAAQRWLTDGNAACSNKWNGTITETTNASESVQIREVRTETRITITVVDSKATADVHWQMTDFTDVKTRECATYVHHTFLSDATKLPVDLTIVLNTPALPTGPITLPEGITLPPGATLPGFTLPPGMTLPPGIVGVPTGGPFFMYSGALVKGNHHTDLRTLPGCKRVVKDEAHPYNMTPCLTVARRYRPHHLGTVQSQSFLLCHLPSHAEHRYGFPYRWHADTRPFCRAEGTCHDRQLLPMTVRVLSEHDSACMTVGPTE